MTSRHVIHVNHTQQLYDQLHQDFPVISDTEIRGDIAIGPDNYACKGLTFHNCEFQEKVSFAHLELGLGLRFIDCTFNKACSFAQVTATGIQDNFNGDNNGIYFKNCSHLKSVFVDHCKLERSFRFDQQQQLECLHVQTLETAGLDIYESKIGGLDINQLNARLGLRIEKSEVSGQGRYFGCLGGGITFMGTVCKRDQQLWANKFGSIITNDGRFEDELKIKACQADSYFFAGTEFKKGLNITTHDPANHLNVVIKSLGIRDCDLKGGFNFTGHRLGNLVANLEKLTITCSNLLLGNMTFEGTDIVEVNLGGTNAAASINFHQCSFRCVTMDHFVNQGRLYFAEIKSLQRVGSVFSIAKTSLGAALLLNVNLLHFESVIIKHSQLTDIIFTDVKWFRYDQLNPVATYNDAVNVDEIYQFKKGLQEPGYRRWALIKTNREVYRQLKYAAQRLGDNLQALIFQGQEMNLYKQELDFYRLTRNTAGNKMMMWLNRSNDYGNDWLKPVGLLLLTNLVLYCFITLLQSDGFYLWPSVCPGDISATWNMLSTHLDAYWSLLNPVRRLSDVYGGKKDFSAWTIFWDYMNRVLVSYFIFQVVSAFRKYNKGG